MKYDKEMITARFLQDNDGRLVWIRSDYLSMRGMSDDKELIEFLEHVETVKTQAKRNGVKFSA